MNWNNVGWIDNSGGQRVATDDLGARLAITAIAQAATESMLAAQLKMQSVEQVKAEILDSVYWPQFFEAAQAGQVPTDWLPGALGRAVLGWAKTCAG